MKRLPINLLISAAFFILYSLIFLSRSDMPLSAILLCYFSVFAFLILIRLPPAYFLTLHIFTFLGELLGTGFSLYRAIPPYDLLLHFLSGIILFIFGLYFWKCAEKTGRSMAGALFSLFFSLSGAGVWEIWEYLGDLLFALQSQGTLKDTMEDIIAGSLGGLIAYSVYIFIKKRPDEKF
jgi:uncharacterized membrane protein YjdF